MVRFSCFSSSVHQHKSKRGVQYASGAMHLNPQATSQDQTMKISMDSASSKLKADDNNLSTTSMEQGLNLSSHEGCWKSEDVFIYSCLRDNKEDPHVVHLKKSQSLGNILDKNRDFSGDDLAEDGNMDHGFSFNHSHDQNMKRFTDSIGNTGSVETYNHKDSRIYFGNQNRENVMVVSPDPVTDTMHHEPLFSIGVLEQSDGEQSADCVANSEQFSSDTQPALAKSSSASNLRAKSVNSIEGALNSELVVPRSKSHENLSSIDGRREKSVDADEELHFGVTSHEHDVLSFSPGITKLFALDGQSSLCHANTREECFRSNTSGNNEVADQERDISYLSEKSKSESQSKDGKWSTCHVDLAEDCLLSNSSGELQKVGDETNKERDGKFWCEKPDCEIESAGMGKILQQGSSVQSWDELSPQEFSIRRIEDWISQIDIQNDNIVEEMGESSSSFSKEHPHKVTGMTATKFDAKSSLGTEVAYNYISGLNAASSSAQMANLGLFAIPVLSSFAGLRVLNLSNNMIVRITAGALPKGLHMLNLSKNNISAIEGLRELTRLRILDLSYNRICRIGHGLASCSSLRELYLAGNKISEVEGLHRLLKLNILDLRVNKISTSKGLGQLAANYGSLQTINIEGNPAQKNVGDEQLKKCLLSLLPHLIYYNKHAVRASGLKEVSDRLPRSLSTHQVDRSIRSEYKHSRRAALGSGLHKSSSGLIRPGQSANSLLKLAKNWNGRLPPIGLKPNDHIPNFDRNLSSLHSSKPIRRVFSDGELRESISHA